MFRGRRSAIGRAVGAAVAIWLAVAPLISAASVVDTFHVGLSPTDAGVNTATGLAYVTNWGGATVSVVDTRRDRVVDSIDVGLHPITAGVNPVTNRIYVNNVGCIDAISIGPLACPSGKFGQSVSVIDGATNKVIKTIDIGARTQSGGVAVDTTTNRIYRYVLQRRRRGEIGRRRQLAMRESAADVERQRSSPGRARER